MGIGIIMQKYPNVLGTDVAGEVYEVGEGVTHVKKGDRVIGYLSLLPLPLPLSYPSPPNYPVPQESETRLTLDGKAIA
jgi:NADPH:quinone reductase-like Zn-dependent oxidoreductase